MSNAWQTFLLISPWFLYLLLIIGLAWIYLATSANSGFRGVITYLTHLLIFVVGWGLGKWLGILLISFPILIYYYYMLFHLSMVVVPISDPDIFSDWWLRFLIFVRYQWGVQYPHWMTAETTGGKIEKRIKGDQFSFFAPGLISARSHQVIGITTGMTFSRVPNPGTIFTNRYESPLAVVDLRTQIRSAWIEVVSSDGIPFWALLFTAFRVDQENWSRELYHKLRRQNPLFENAHKPDYQQGAYPFSKPRLQALFSTIGVSSPENINEAPRTLSWDERAFNQIEKTAREALSQRKINELWQPQNDNDGASAMDEIAIEIKENCTDDLRRRGILVYASRIVDVEFHKNGEPHHEEQGKNGNAEINSPQNTEQAGEEDPIAQKQITAWSIDWQREATKTRAEGKAHADFLTQEAHAYAYTTLLTAFAEGMEEARLLDPQLPRYVIAVRFVGALEKIIGQQSDTQAISEARASLDQIKKMIPWGMDGG